MRGIKLALQDLALKMQGGLMREGGGGGGGGRICGTLRYCTLCHSSFHHSGVDFVMRTVEIEGKRIQLQVWYVSKLFLSFLHTWQCNILCTSTALPPSFPVFSIEFYFQMVE